MLSAKMVQMIEGNWEEIAAQIIEKIHQHPELPQLARRSDAEMKEWCQDILENLDYWLLAGNKTELRRRCEVGGRLRFEESIPLPEAVLRLHIAKDLVLKYIREHGLPISPVQLYAEEELLHRVCGFFDSLVYYVVCGYTSAMLKASRMAS